jgi:hypothetical protein
MKVRMVRVGIALVATLVVVGWTSPAASAATSTVEHDVVVTQPTLTCAQEPYCGDLDAWSGTYNGYGFWEWSLNNPRWAHSDAQPQEGDSECKVTSAAHAGSYASQCTVYPTDGVSSADRAEAVTTNENGTGDTSQTQFYGWWTYFPGPSQDWWHVAGDFNDITQFGEYPNGLDGANWLYFGIDATLGRTPTPNIFAKFGGSTWFPHTTIASALQYDHWYHFVVEARWSTDASVGYVSIWLDGVNVVPKRFGQTLTGTATQVHVTQGIYRAAYTSTNTVVHDGLCRAVSYTDAAAC